MTALNAPVSPSSVLPAKEEQEPAQGRRAHLDREGHLEGVPVSGDAIARRRLSKPGQLWERAS